MAITQPAWTNVRSGPGLGYNVLTVVSQGTQARIIGIDAQWEWYQVELDELVGPGWIFRDLTTLVGSLAGISQIGLGGSSSALATAVNSINVELSRPPNGTIDLEVHWTDVDVCEQGYNLYYRTNSGPADDERISLTPAVTASSTNARSLSFSFVREAGLLSAWCGEANRRGGRQIAEVEIDPYAPDTYYATAPSTAIPSRIDTPTPTSTAIPPSQQQGENTPPARQQTQHSPPPPAATQESANGASANTGSVPLAITQPAWTNVRSGPGLGYNVLTVVSQGTQARIIGIDAQWEWYQVELDELVGPGWIFRDLTTLVGSLAGISQIGLGGSSSALATAVNSINVELSRPPNGTIDLEVHWTDVDVCEQGYNLYYRTNSGPADDERISLTPAVTASSTNARSLSFSFVREAGLLSAWCGEANRRGGRQIAEVEIDPYAPDTYYATAPSTRDGTSLASVAGQ